MKKNRKWFPVHPYVFYMNIVFLTLLIGGLLWGLHLLWSSEINTIDAKIDCTVIFLSIYAVYFVYAIICPYELYGIIQVQTEGVLIRVPFRRKMFIGFEGMDNLEFVYAKQTGIWIYFGLERFPNSYRNKLHSLRISKKHFRVQFSDSLYNELMRHAPYHSIGKRLSKNYSVVRIHGTCR